MKFTKLITVGLLLSSIAQANTDNFYCSSFCAFTYEKDNKLQEKLIRTKVYMTGETKLLAFENLSQECALRNAEAASKMGVTVKSSILWRKVPSSSGFSSTKEVLVDEPNDVCFSNRINICEAQ